MSDAGPIIAAFQDIAATKNLSPDEVNDLLKDGIMAGLSRIHGPNVQAEINIDDTSGGFDIVVSRKHVGTTTGSKWVMLWRSQWTSKTSDAMP